MARGLPWFRYWTTMHGKGKARALSDPEFRLLTRIWALSRESERPGWVFVVEGVGWDPKDLAQTAGCKGGSPEKMLARLVELRWIRLHSGGVIEVHDWEEHNPPVSPSKTPAARAEQKRKERKAKRQPVASMSPGDTRATVPDVGSLELEVDVDVEKTEDAQARARAQSEQTLVPGAADAVTPPPTAAKAVSGAIPDATAATGQGEAEKPGGPATIAPVTPGPPVRPTAPPPTGRLSPLPRREERLAQRFPLAAQLRNLVAETWPHIARASTETDLHALEARCAARGTAAFAWDCVAFADARGEEPRSLTWFARCLPDIPEAEEQGLRAAGELPRWGDPDFDDPSAYPDHNAYQARSAPAEAVPISGPAIRRVEP